MSEKEKADTVSFEAFNTAVMEFQEQWRKEFKQIFLKEALTAPFKEIAGLKRAAELVWKDVEPEEGEQDV